LQQAAKAGVLNLLDMHTVESVIPYMKGYQAETDYADYFAAGAAATAPTGHGTQYGFPTPTLTKPSEAKAFIEGRVTAGADYIKIIKEPWKATLDSATVAELVKEAHLKNKKAVVHVSRNHNALEVVRSGVDGLVHVWRDSVMSDAQMKSLVKHDFFVVPTMLTRKSAKEMYDKANRKVVHISVDELKQEVFRLYENKVPILAGTDPPNLQINYGTDLYKEILLIHEAGVPIVDALKSATSLPAIHFELENRGFIKEGYRADMILIEGDLLADINVIWNEKRVWKQGKEVNTKE
jgi:imidazolonepropionase-like amidohydrolase